MALPGHNELSETYSEGQVRQSYKMVDIKIVIKSKDQVSQQMAVLFCLHND